MLTLEAVIETHPSLDHAVKIMSLCRNEYY